MIKNLFCTRCGAQAATSQNHCDNCGLWLHDATASSPGGAAHGIPAYSKPSTLFTWVDVGGKSLAFGAPLVAVFDFLSPRIALLPTAAVVAVVGLVVAVALRKYVAPSLPLTNWLRRVLAPEANLHKSPMLIATGMLSALMVAGAAWSSVNAAEGGLIASKFDAAKNAQMQLGVMQGLQKEQRVQTAVLEDIREGRTSNPRRELSNQGIAWDSDKLAAAVDNSDITVVQLFLNGGMRWRLWTIERAVERGDQKIMALFQQYPMLLDHNEDCWRITLGVIKGKLSDFRKTELKYHPQPVPALTTIDKEFVKLFCTSTKDVAYLNRELKSESERYQKQLKERAAITNSVGISSTPGTRRTGAECKRDLLANNAKLLSDRAYTFVSHMQDCGGFACYPYASASDELLNAVKEKNPRGASALTEQTMLDIEKYCDTDSGRNPPFDNFDMQVLKQIIDAIS